MGSPSRLYVDTTDGIRVSGGVRIAGTGVHHLPTSMVRAGDESEFVLGGHVPVGWLSPRSWGPPRRDRRSTSATDPTPE
jgi:hypothetical protein